MRQVRGAISLVAISLFCAAIAPSSVVAAGSYEFDPVLSLRGNCTASGIDPIADPGCPYPPPPAGPSGRFSEPRSIAIDAYGNEYVASHAGEGGGANGRIDVFDDEGNFITELPDPHGPKSVAVDSKGNLYVFEQTIGSAELARYAPTVYEPAAGKIEYGPRTVFATKPGSFLGGLAVDFSNDHLYASYGNFPLEEFGSAAEGNPLLNTIENPKFNWSNWVSVDGQRQRLYVSYCKKETLECGILALSADPPYTLLKELDGSDTPAGKFVSTKGWISTAVDETTGHVFAGDLEASKNIYEFDENFEYFATTTFSAFEGPNSLQIALSNSPKKPLAKNRRYLFVPLPREAGAAFALHPPLAGPPDVEVVAAANIAEREAELRATIDPNGAATTYVLEYVTQGDFEEEGFANARLAGAGTIPAIDAPTEVAAAATGLSPGTSYRFRAVATNDEGSDEEEGSFATYADAPSPGSCPNQVFRIGLSSSLPDCRAYELVTPAETNGRAPKGVGFGGDRFSTVEAAPSGNVVGFVTEGGSLPGTEGTGGFNGDLYRTVRSSDGWGGIVRMGPSGTETNNPSPGSTSPDQEHAFFWAGGEGSAVVGKATTHYVRYPDGRAELVGRGSLGTDPSARGVLITEGGSHIIFKTRNEGGALAQQLEPGAPPDGTSTVYDRTADEVTHVVSLLPGNTTPDPNESADYVDASADGNGIAFSIGSTLYLRVDNAVTYEVGKDVALADVSEGGDRVFYIENGDLFALDVQAEEEVIRFTETGDAIVVNVAPDGSRAYFISEEAISGAGENPNGAAPQAGEQNLYLSEEGSIRFVGTVTARDVEGELSIANTKVDGLGLWTQVQASQPAIDPSRVNPDGSILLFQSQANLTGYDSGEFPQIYRYDSAGDRLHCLSCIPTGAAATGGATLETYAAAQTTRPPFSAFGFVPNLRADGKRAFFQSTEALVSADRDQVQDVYEWEEEGVGSCVRPGGCIYLISSGRSARDNYLYGVSASGDDVFFVTEDILVAGDNNTASIYDARVGGGFPQEPDGECEGEGCHLPVLPAPALTSPATRVVGGAEGSVKPPSRRCPKGKRKVKRHGKVRCVKKKQSKKQRRGATAKKGAGR